MDAPSLCVVFNNDHIMPRDGNWGRWCPGCPQIHHQFFSLCCVELQVAQLTPSDKAVYRSPVFSLLTLADTSNDSRLIRILLKMARLCLVAEVCGVKGERKGERRVPFKAPVLLTTSSDTECPSAHTVVGQ